MSRVSDPNWKRAYAAVLVVVLIASAWVPLLLLWRFFHHFVKF